MSVPVIRLVVCNSASSWDVWGSLSSPPACGPRHVEACFILSSIDSSSLLLSRLRFGNCRAMVRGFVLNPFLCKGPVPSARFGLWASSPFPGGMPASIDVECCGPALASVQRLLVLRGSPTSVLGSGPLLRGGVRGFEYWYPLCVPYSPVWFLLRVCSWVFPGWGGGLHWL